MWQRLRGHLVAQIVVGLVLGVLFALIWPAGGKEAGLLGSLFVTALRSIAPILVFVLITHAIAQHKVGESTNIRAILLLYVVGTFAAAMVAVLMASVFVNALDLSAVISGAQAAKDIAPPSSLVSVLKTLLYNMVDNPVRALVNANYIGILVWACLVGFSLRHASESTKAVVNDGAQVITKIVSLVVRLAPIGVFGLIAQAVAETGVSVLKTYSGLLGVLLSAMVLMALVINPLIVWIKIRKNPYPLVWTCLTQSGITAFFMRSSAANIPVNMRLCSELDLKEETYAISIPLGATINMAGAAITITVMAMAAAHTVGVSIHPVTALMLCFLATLGACGASGVPGGSMLLVPMACSLFSIDANIAAQMVGIGFVIGVLQDSTETALNSSTDVLYTAAADIAARGRDIPRVHEETSAAL